MKQFQFLFSTVLFILSISFQLTIQAQNTQVSKARDLQINTIMNALLEQTKVPGVSIAVSQKGSIIYRKGFGFSNVENNLSMHPNTRLRTASVAKVITAAAIGRLMSEGKLDLDEPIKTYIPYINKKYAHLTSRQLAAHTSGLEHRPKGSRYKKKQYNTIKETVQLMNSKLLFTPDTDYKYSTHAFNLLAAVIEGASGKPYINYLNEEVFTPLKMTETYPENIQQLSDNDAKLYYINKLKLKKEKLTNGSYKVPGAGFRSTPSDLVKMTHAFSNGFLSQEVIKEMVEKHELSNGKKINVGVTWRLSVDSFDNKVIEHAGNWLGARTVVVYYPERELSISLMINASCQILIEETAHVIAQLFMNDGEKTALIDKTNERIKLTFRGEKEKKYDGQFTFEDKKGCLKTNSSGFLKSNPIYHLYKENYVLVSSFGLLHMTLSNNESTLNGSGYIYNTMNSENPKNKTPMISFTSL